MRTSANSAGSPTAPLRELPAAIQELEVSSTQTPFAAPQLGLAHIERLSPGEAHIRIGGKSLAARVDAHVDDAVLQSALERQEPILVEHRPNGIFVVGALRTRATPGVDKTKEVTIEAEKIRLVASEEVTVRSGPAMMVVRAIGEVETYAERIISRAEGVHKIIGRMLRLN
ncbi:MAG: hypothetical protein U0271_16600 [Polyangiaceae bacterium]